MAQKTTMNTIAACEHSCKICSMRCHRQQQAPVPAQQAMEILFQNTVMNVKPEIVPLRQALNRVTAEATYARLNVPCADTSKHDGIAVQWGNTFQCMAQGRHVLEQNEFSVQGMSSVIPAGLDTVVPDELIEYTVDGRVRILTLPCQGEGIARAGSSIQWGEEIVPANRRLTPSQLSVLRLAGIEEVAVWKRPRAAIIPIGKELCLPGTKILEPGQTIEADSILIETIIAECGGEAWTTPIVADDTELICEAIRGVLDSCDFLVLIGGVGRGGLRYGDYSHNAVDSLGRVLVHGVDFRPGGKPTLFGEIDKKCVVGIPGPPHAALTQAEQHLPAIMEHFLGCPCYERPEIYAKLDADFQNKKDDHYHPHIGLKWDGSEYEIFPIRRGDTVDCFVRAAGILMAEEDEHFYQKGDKVRVRLTSGERTVRMQSP